MRQPAVPFPGRAPGLVPRRAAGFARRRALGLAVALGALAGCAGPAASPGVTAPVATGPVATGPVSSPSAVVPSTCPGTPGAAPTPCTPAQLEELTTKAALYTEAEQVYRRFFEEDGKVAVTGKDASPEVLALLGGPFMDSYRAERNGLLGVTASGYGEVRYVRPAPGAFAQGSEVAVLTCVDGSDYVAFGQGKELGHLPIRQSIYYLKRVDGTLRIWWQISAKVPTC